jgi:hypothetical protein
MLLKSIAKSWQPTIKIKSGFTPVRRSNIGKAIETFCEKEECQDATLPYHRLRRYVPLIGSIYRKIGGKAGKNKHSRRNFVAFITFTAQRQIEIAVFAYLATANFRTVHFILTIDITVFASGIDFYTSVPRIPVGIFLLER